MICLAMTIYLLLSSPDFGRVDDDTHNHTKICSEGCAALCHTLLFEQHRLSSQVITSTPHIPPSQVCSWGAN